MYNKLYLLAFICQFITSFVQCHRNGAPNKSCKSLLPHHKHITYEEISAQINTFVVDGNNINIDILSEKPFKGMLKCGWVIFQPRIIQSEIFKTWSIQLRDYLYLLK